jgi:hypothetical protein
MDNSKMAKDNASMTYKPFEHDKGRAKLSRELDLHKTCKCSEKECHCNCNSIGDPLEWTDDKTDSKIK